MTVPYDELDPGIREVVRWLNDHGFNTNDSGDGKAKFTEEGEPLPEWDTADQGYDCVIPFPHVVMSVEVGELGPECDRLRDLLLEQGVAVGAQGPEEETISIQGSYDPCLSELPAFIMLMGLDNAGLV